MWTEPLILWLGLFAVFIAAMFVSPLQATGFATSYTPIQRTAWSSLFGTIGAAGLIFVWLAVSRKKDDITPALPAAYKNEEDENIIFEQYKYKPNEFVRDVVKGVGRNADEKIPKAEAYALLKKIGYHLEKQGVSGSSVSEAVSYVNTAVGDYTDIESMVRMVMGYAIKRRERPDG
jgi:hypothetical protein